MGSRDTFVLRRKRKESRRQGLEQNRRQKQQSRRNVKARKRTESETLFWCQKTEYSATGRRAGVGLRQQRGAVREKAATTFPAKSGVRLWLHYCISAVMRHFVFQ